MKTGTVHTDTKTRLALDSNVWRYLVDAEMVAELRRVSKEWRVEIVMLPAVLYETLRMHRGPVRDRVLDAQTRQIWSRAMPEAYSEAEELRRAIAKLRPHWLAATPDLRRWHELRADWAADGRSGTWSRARKAPDIMSRLIGDGQIPGARAEARAARDAMAILGLSFAALKVEAFESWFEEPIEGWNGNHFQTWRAEGLNVWLPVIAGQTGGYADWLLPWIQPKQILKDFSSWVRFWTEDVQESELPRQWIRSAMRIAASTRKVSDGAPVDIQISTYLYDCDVFCTSDRVFADCLAKVRSQAPRPVAETWLLPAGPTGVEALLASISGASTWS
jgi:hypothetical protein